MMNNNGVITNYTYDRNNKLISDTNSTYTYDNNGNMLSKTTGETVSIYTYDPMNKLKSVTSDDGLTASYTYDAKGRRVAKTVNGVATNHVWDGEYIIREKNGSGTEISRYYRAGNKLVANKSNNATNYYYSDPHGNVVSVGNNENIYTYDAFGNQTSTPANDANPFRYCGEYFDNETGFIYLRNRYYDSSIGRFITEDPAKDGMNWYVYCSNNPVMFIDPSGLEQIVVSGGNYGESEGYKYNFIEPAIKKLRELKENNSNNENITWIIANAGWTRDDINSFKEVSNEIGVGLEFINDKDELFNYINYKYGGTDDNRVNDLITKFVVFSHGLANGTLSLGYNYESYNKALNISMEDLTLDKIKTFDAFNNPNSMFYSCNTGTDIDGEWGNNFAQKWVNLTGGKTWAYAGYTYYGNMNSAQGIKDKISRKLHGFSYYGASNYPEAYKDAKLITFWR